MKSWAAPGKVCRRKAKRMLKDWPKVFRKIKTNAGAKPGGKGPSSPSAGGDLRGEPENARSASPLARLIQPLGEEKIRFQIAGMTAAVMQGGWVTTFDTDIWVDLPERRHVRLMNPCVKQGATALAPTPYILSDGRAVNFLFRINGLGSFKTEYRKAVTRTCEGIPVKALHLKSILKSKKTIMREKDKLHILMIERVLDGREQEQQEE